MATIHLLEEMDDFFMKLDGLLQQERKAIHLLEKMDGFPMKLDAPT